MAPHLKLGRYPTRDDHLFQTGPVLGPPTFHERDWRFTTYWIHGRVLSVPDLRGRAIPEPPAHAPHARQGLQHEHQRELYVLRDDLLQLRAELREHRADFQTLCENLQERPLDRRAVTTASRIPDFRYFYAIFEIVRTVLGAIGYFAGLFLGTATREEARPPAAAGDGAECGRAGPTPAVGVPGTPSSRPRPPPASTTP